MIYYVVKKEKKGYRWHAKEGRKTLCSSANYYARYSDAATGLSVYLETIGE